jgi:hypothetical protein
LSFVGKCSNLCRQARLSDLVVAKDIVFFRVAAVGTFQAADQEHGNADCHQNGESVIGGCEPLNQAIHLK